MIFLNQEDIMPYTNNDYRVDILTTIGKTLILLFFVVGSTRKISQHVWAPSHAYHLTCKRKLWGIELEPSNSQVVSQTHPSIPELH